MTAEVAVMNKMAVALAADSAITIGGDTGQKIYNTGNKLFALSKYRPVGVMIYGNAELMSVPWETVIKQYRAALATTRFDELPRYVDNLISFLERRDHCLWDDSFQDLYFKASLAGYYQYVLSEINDRIKKALTEAPSIEVSQVASIVAEVVASEFADWEAAPHLPNFPRNFPKRALLQRGNQIKETAASTFQKLPLSKEALDQLRQIGAHLPCRNKFSDAVSGVVIAGFGDKEVFPSIHYFICEGVFAGKLKFATQEPVKVDRSSDAIIVPFAQREMVNNFIEGIDPVYQATLEGYIRELVSKYPEQVLAAIPELTQDRRDQAARDLAQVADSILSDFSSRMGEYRGKHHVSPILKAVAVLPKDELAAMAESLVNLTSFKRRVSLQAETVGGPIDVAVISKGDGFIWIKRKHYFSRDLNQAFFANYYRDE